MIELKIKSDPAELTTVREALSTWAAGEGWDEQQIGEIILAVDEALTNVIRHGYSGQPTGEIDVQIATVAAGAADEGVEVRIRDYCPSVDLERICGRDLDDVRPGGLGVHLIRAMMEHVEYSHAAGGGMLLVLRKRKTHYAKHSDNPGAES